MADVCQICGATKEEHSGYEHIFSLDGSLKAKSATKQPPPIQNASLVTNHLSGLILRLIETLAAKGLLDARELAYIFGREADNVPSDRGEAPGGDSIHRP